MPIYEYQCRACGAPHEAMHKMSAPPLRKCPACGKSQLKRLISAPLFRLKGGGWYETDFKSDQESKRNLHADEKPDKAAAADSKPAAGADAKGDAKGDTKGDTKGDAKADGKAEAPKAEAKAEPPPASASAAESKRGARTPNSTRRLVKPGARGGRSRSRPGKRR